MRQESLLLFAGQELVVARDRVEQDLRVTIVQMSSCEEVGANHLQAVAARFVRAQHPPCRLDRLLDDRDLALVELELGDFGRFGVLAREVLVHLAFELIPG